MVVKAISAESDRGKTSFGEILKRGDNRLHYVHPCPNEQMRAGRW
jgi:hypothetical protein